MSIRVGMKFQLESVGRPEVRPGTAVGANLPRPYVPIVTSSIPTGHWYVLDLARPPFDQSGNASGAFEKGRACLGGKMCYQDGLGSALGLPSKAYKPQF
jgi:hypothetical protein